MDQFEESDQHEDENIPDVPIEVHSSDQTIQTDRAVYRIDPRTFGLEVWPDPRPDDRTDRTEARLSQPIQHCKTDSRARFNLGREESEDVHIFSLMAFLVRPACLEGCPKGLASVSDPMMEFYLSYFTKAWIIELCKDLFHNSTQLGSADRPIVQSVRFNQPTGRVDRPDHVLILTPSTSTTRMNLDRRRIHFDQSSSISPTLTPFIIF